MLKANVWLEPEPHDMSLPSWRLEREEGDRSLSSTVWLSYMSISHVIHDPSVKLSIAPWVVNTLLFWEGDTPWPYGKCAELYVYDSPKFLLCIFSFDWFWLSPLTICYSSKLSNLREVTETPCICTQLLRCAVAWGSPNFWGEVHLAGIVNQWTLAQILVVNVRIELQNRLSPDQKCLQD